MKVAKKFCQWLPGIRFYLAAIIMLEAVAACLMIVQTYALSYLIRAIFLPGKNLISVGGAWGAWGVTSGLLVLLAMILLRAMMAWCSAAIATRLAGCIKTSIREKLLRHLFFLGPSYTGSERSGELINTITEGVESLEPYYSQYLPQLFLSFIIPVLLLLAIFPVDAPSALILLIMAPLLLFMLAIAGMMASTETKRRWQALSLMNAHFLDVVQGLTALKLFGCSGQEIGNVHTISERFRRATMGTLRLAFFSSLILEAGTMISIAMIAVEVGLRLLLGQITFQAALFVLLLAPQFFQPLRLLGMRYHAGRNGVVAMQRIMEILAAPTPSMAASSATDGLAINGSSTASFYPRSSTMASFSSSRLFSELSREHDQMAAAVYADSVEKEHSQLQQAEACSIRFVDVSYAYHDRDSQRPALQSISFQIPAKQKVALVGASGAGKSTIARLLLRFIEADSGAIYAGDTRLTEISPLAWRKQVAWVPQHPYLFNASVAENICLTSAQATSKEIEEAARCAYAHEFICSLPQGYETVIGEQGARLSGGEAQRISLARAFLKNAPLLILDEATSYLDPQNEAQIMDALARLERGRTVFIVAHRLSTIYDADQIVVVNSGRIVDIGTHHTLLQHSAIYRQLVSTYTARKGSI
jgi:ABC-type transport system involved in cytochrome bd biosynthesis fused ATPase/permease subunit